MTTADTAIADAADRIGSTPVEQLRALFAEHIGDWRTSWSVGTFGAIAEFHRDADEPVELKRGEHGVAAFTSRGALRLSVVPGLRAFAYETVGSQPGQWNHAVALCLPRDLAAMSRRGLLTELGGDASAIRPQDRSALLFDMGLGCQQIDVCVRSADADVLAALRAGAGRSVLDLGNPLMSEMPRLSPHRVFACRFGRVEVYQRVPPPDGTSPMGPHTHVLPKLMREERTHAATVPIPEGWVPCAHLYPAHPMRDALGHAQPFDDDAHQRFQRLLMQLGEPRLWQLRRRVEDSLEQGLGPALESQSLSRHERATVRVALRQWAAAGRTGVSLPAWAAAFDGSAAGNDEA
jgi:hypothetical protein